MADVKRDAAGHRVYAIDKIKDKTLFKAVAFARSMIGKGQARSTACRIAANYYSVSVSDIRHYIAQLGGSYSHRRSWGDGGLH